MLKHGHNRRGGTTPEYRCWYHIKERCLNPKNHDWFYYGGRGVWICWRWKKSFENFLADMGRRPSAKHTIDRINNQTGYHPGNCRWATRQEQAVNRRAPGQARIDYLKHQLRKKKNEHHRRRR
jgi:hypothetical protein